MTRKRKQPSTDGDQQKRVKLTAQGPSNNVIQHSEPVSNQNGAPGMATEPNARDRAQDASSSETRRQIHKLKPPRPFPTVPTSVSATGPRSAHKEGKNYICVTRKTALGAYMRRCKDLIIKDGYKSLHLSAMGAAIPHLAQLYVALPAILPFPSQDIHTEVFTGTIDVRDEVIPEDEEEDISYQTRAKSALRVAIRIGDGASFEEDRGLGRADEEPGGPSKKPKKMAKKRRKTSHNGEEAQEQPTQLILQEPEQPDPDSLS